MGRFLFWLTIWVVTLGAGDIDVRYRDGLHISFKGWITPLQKKFKRKK